MPSITVKAPAKLNLTLDVLGKRADGYHEMKMVMQSVSLADTLTLETAPGEGISLSTNLGFLPVDDRNLAAIAAKKLAEVTGADFGHLTITLKKQVPVCAGMAGGSSDSAAVLRGLNELLGLGLPPETLARIGEKVGSDVPYCVLGGTALAEGRGEAITPLHPLPSCWTVLSKPGFPISTPELFHRLDSQRLRCHPDTAGMLSALEKEDLTGVARRLFNVFEEVLPARRRERVEELKQAMLHAGALGASMSGTGPTVFGLFDTQAAAQRGYELVKPLCRDTFLAQSL
ncbi:MAG: 4-(cytidine 5'-diphospho)-2-C-methyl-D-erythritol kinase [Pseudoflavonifractor sp.]|nr:4-(cytidine 5'-diphospho)-2-C-methyl-D-erythritol kinase [Pseudoflavonifractor sp.]